MADIPFSSVSGGGGIFYPDEATNLLSVPTGTPAGVLIDVTAPDGKLIKITRLSTGNAATMDNVSVVITLPDDTEVTLLDNGILAEIQPTEADFFISNIFTAALSVRNMLREALCKRIVVSRSGAATTAPVDMSYATGRLQ